MDRMILNPASEEEKFAALLGDFALLKEVSSWIDAFDVQNGVVPATAAAVLQNPHHLAGSIPISARAMATVVAAFHQASLEASRWCRQHQTLLSPSSSTTFLGSTGVPSTIPATASSVDASQTGTDAVILESHVERFLQLFDTARRIAEESAAAVSATGECLPDSARDARATAGWLALLCNKTCKLRIQLCFHNFSQAINTLAVLRQFAPGAGDGGADVVAVPRLKRALDAAKVAYDNLLKGISAETSQGGGAVAMSEAVNHLSRVRPLLEDLLVPLLQQSGGSKQDGQPTPNQEPTAKSTAPASALASGGDTGRAAAVVLTVATPTALMKGKRSGDAASVATTTVAEPSSGVVVPAQPAVDPVIVTNATLDTAPVAATPRTSKSAKPAAVSPTATETAVAPLADADETGTKLPADVSAEVTALDPVRPVVEKKKRGRKPKSALVPISTTGTPFAAELLSTTTTTDSVDAVATPESPQQPNDEKREGKHYLDDISEFERGLAGSGLPEKSKAIRTAGRKSGGRGRAGGEVVAPQQLSSVVPADTASSPPQVPSVIRRMLKPNTLHLKRLNTSQPWGVGLSTSTTTGPAATQNAIFNRIDGFQVSGTPVVARVNGIAPSASSQSVLTLLKEATECVVELTGEYSIVPLPVAATPAAPPAGAGVARGRQELGSVTKVPTSVSGDAPTAAAAAAPAEVLFDTEVMGDTLILHRPRSNQLEPWPLHLQSNSETNATPVLVNMNTQRLLPLQPTTTKRALASFLRRYAIPNSASASTTGAAATTTATLLPVVGVNGVFFQPTGAWDQLRRAVHSKKPQARLALQVALHATR